MRSERKLEISYFVLELFITTLLRVSRFLSITKSVKIVKIVIKASGYVYWALSTMIDITNEAMLYPIMGGEVAECEVDWGTMLV